MVTMVVKRNFITRMLFIHFFLLLIVEIAPIVNIIPWKRGERLNILRINTECDEVSNLIFNHNKQEDKS